MSDITRDDLRIATICTTNCGPWHAVDCGSDMERLGDLSRSITDEDVPAILKALLDVDVEALREALRRFTSFRPGVRMDSEQVMVDAVSQVLAALDGEEA